MTGGGLSNFSGSGTTYTATFTPLADSITDGVINVAINSFSDGVGNKPGGSSLTIFVDTQSPTLAIISDKSSLAKDETTTVTFTLSESSSDFSKEDITITGGALSNFSEVKSWNQLGQDIDGEAPSDTSGQSVSLSSDGNYVAIGAYVS